MSHGLPLIASDVGGIDEIVSEGKNGYKVPTKDSLVLAEKMELLIQRECLRKKFKENSILDYQHNFSPKIIRNKYLELYRKTD